MPSIHNAGVGGSSPPIATNLLININMLPTLLFAPYPYHWVRVTQGLPYDDMFTHIASKSADFVLFVLSC